MRAMVLAAGLGTRLRPLTNDRPKALVEIDGRSLLEIALARLRSFDITDVIVNVHHFADKIVDYLKGHDNFGMNIAISREEVLLDTGGGLKKASHFFLQGSADEPFIVYNVDVLSSINLSCIVDAHRSGEALATLAVQHRDSSRLLLFDQDSQLCGRQSRGAAPEIVRPASEIRSLAFCGIHVISPRIFSSMNETGVFPIVPVYLRLSGQGERVVGFPADDYYWRDLGRRESLEQAARDLREKVVLQ
jgi:NDP-sugar pyrophosphorylase family protein